MSMNDPATTIRVARYVPANRELIQDPAVVEELDRISAFLVGSQQGLGQRDVEAALDQGFDLPPTPEWTIPPLDYAGSQVLFDAIHAAAYAGAYAAVKAVGLGDGAAAAAGDAAGIAATSQVVGDTAGTKAYAGSAAGTTDSVGHIITDTDTLGGGGPPALGGTTAMNNTTVVRPTPPPSYPPLGPDPGDPSVFNPVAAGAALVPFFSTQPAGGIADFWVPGAFILHGAGDIGECLRGRADGKFIEADNSGGGGIAVGGALFFESNGTVPVGATIISVQYRVALTCVDQNLSSLVRSSPGGIDVIFPSFTVPFTGSGLFLSNVYPINPDTSLPWTYDDVFAQGQLPFTDPTGFQGWYALGASGGGGGDPALEVLTLDYFDLLVVWTP